MIAVYGKAQTPSQRFISHLTGKPELSSCTGAASVIYGISSKARLWLYVCISTFLCKSDLWQNINDKFCFPPKNRHFCAIKLNLNTFVFCSIAACWCTLTNVPVSVCSSGECESIQVAFLNTYAYIAQNVAFLQKKVAKVAEWLHQCLARCQVYGKQNTAKTSNCFIVLNTC